MVDIYIYNYITIANWVCEPTYHWVPQCHLQFKTYVSIKQWSTHGGSTICLFLNIHIKLYKIHIIFNWRATSVVTSVPFPPKAPKNLGPTFQTFMVSSVGLGAGTLWSFDIAKITKFIPFLEKQYRKWSFAIAILDYQSVNMYELWNEVWNEAAITVSYGPN